MTDMPRRPTIEDLKSRDLVAREPEVNLPSSFPVWAHLLAGPTIWLVHFLGLYFLSEDVCADVNYGYTNSLSVSTLRTIIFVATAVAVVACLAMAIVGRRKISQTDRDGDDPFIIRVGSILALASAFGVLMVGLTAVWVGTC